MKYSMFIGRWQPWHKGHQWLIDQRLKDGKNVLICVRDVIPDEKNPYTSEEVYDNLHKDPLLKEFIKLNYSEEDAFKLIYKDFMLAEATNLNCTKALVKLT